MVTAMADLAELFVECVRGSWARSFASALLYRCSGGHTDQLKADYWY